MPVGAGRDRPLGGQGAHDESGGVHARPLRFGEHLSAQPPRWIVDEGAFAAFGRLVHADRSRWSRWTLVRVRA